MGRIPFVEHLENGKMLKRLRLRLMETIPRGKRKSIADKSAEVKALKFLDELKSILDDIVYRDYPEKSGKECCAVYYCDREITEEIKHEDNNG